MAVRPFNTCHVTVKYRLGQPTRELRKEHGYGEKYDRKPNNPQMVSYLTLCTSKGQYRQLGLEPYELRQ